MTDDDTSTESHEELLSIPDPNNDNRLVGEVLPDDWTPDADR